MPSRDSAVRAALAMVWLSMVICVWLDIETGNSWSKTQSLNDDVIEGATDYIQQHGATAGVYSTAYMWKTIAGSSFRPGMIPIPTLGGHCNSREYCCIIGWAIVS